MVQTSDKKDNSDKKEEIIIAAQKRFGLYGHNKTSMNEIAKDLQLSKALLYYYFPDKEHLYNAVLEKEIDDFKNLVISSLKEKSTPQEQLAEYTRLRLDNFKAFLNLSRFRTEELQAFKTVMCKTKEKLKEFEEQTIAQILESGNEQNIFELTDTKSIAELILDLFRGLRISMVKDKKLFYLEQEEFDLLKNKTETLIKIFTKGISK